MKTKAFQLQKKKRFKLNSSIFSSVTSSHVLVPFEYYGHLKKIFQHFFHVYLVEELNEIPFRETNITLLMHQIFNILDPEFPNGVVDFGVTKASIH